MKKRIIACGAAALILGVGAGTSYAYLTGQDKVENVFRASETVIEIKENFVPEPKPKPGTVITKAPRISSSSGTDCYVRAMVRFSDSEAEKFCHPLEINDGWTLMGDGYYYWKEKVRPGAETGTIFDTVKIREEALTEEIIPFDILVYAEAVQCGKLDMTAAWKTMDAPAAAEAEASKTAAVSETAKTSETAGPGTALTMKNRRRDGV